MRPEYLDLRIDDAINTETRSPEQSRFQSIRLLTVLLGILALILSGGLLALYLLQHTVQLLVIGGLFLGTMLYAAIASLSFYPRGKINLGLGGLSVCFAIAILGASSLITGLGFPAAIIFLIFSLIVSSTALENHQENLAIVLGIIVAGLSALATAYSPFPQVTIEVIGTVTPAVLGVLFMVYVTMLSMQFVTATLRTRLVTAFMAIVIVPLAILSLIQSNFMFSVLSNEVNQALKLAAQQTALGIDNFMEESRKSVIQTAELEIFSRYLEIPENERAARPEETELRVTMRVLDANEVNSTAYLSSYALLDNQGNNIYDSLRDRVTSRLSPEVLRKVGIDIDSIVKGKGLYEGDQEYFKRPMQTGGAYISPMQVVNSTKAFFYISAPVKNKKGQPIGVVRARFDGLLLQDLLRKYNRLITDHSYALLFDDNNIRLADALSPYDVYKAVAPMNQAKADFLISTKRLPNLPSDMLWTNNTKFEHILNSANAQNPYFNTTLGLGFHDAKDNEIGAVINTNVMPWKVVYLRTDFSNEKLRDTERKLTTLVTVLIAGLVGLIAVGIAQVLSSPIIQLTKTAQQISSGDLQAQATVVNSDEFGMLGVAFNMMTSQLRGLIGDLEERVRTRTHEIEQQNLDLTSRARQLQTVSEVARQIVSAQELESLLSSITRLISERFGFYHVGIFLVDDARQYAVLRAANSSGGQHMLERQHRLPIGKVGIVGYTTGAGQARIATDVGEDATFFNNPDLPQTRSEMALPLKVGDQIIGALDIQSVEANAFRQNDIELFTTLADQVAIAIYNNQLYTETLRALNEAQNLHRQYLRSEWVEETGRRKVLGYLFNQAGIVAQQVENPLWKKVFNNGEPVYAMLPGKEGSQDKAIMAVPIAVRGETIGVIHVQDQGNERLWSEDEVAVVNSIANQVAVALENARLFENTVRRAEREKKVLQITARIRATNNPQEMMQIAISELQQALHATRTQIYIREESDALQADALQADALQADAKQAADMQAPADQTNDGRMDHAHENRKHDNGSSGHNHTDAPGPLSPDSSFPEI